MKIEYPCTIIHDEPSGYLVQFVDIEEAFTGGATVEEALFNASEVLTSILSYRLDNKIDVPLPSVIQPDQYAVAPDSATQTAMLLSEAGDYWNRLRGVLETSRVRGANVHDARIAALCRAHGVTVLLSADRDFSRFPWLSTKNPV